ncbi:MAG: hypothetical protein LQ352_007405 [Teloschistes flavicans]|nr:MAG: hypothetical protein LQ352_007405 [Teloschistes flavicans]
MNSLLLRATTFLGILISLVSCAPAVPRIGNGSSISLNASPKTNLSFPNWPSPPFFLRLAGTYRLAIYGAEAYAHNRPQPSVPLIREFVRDFGDNLAHAYPTPALAPKAAGQMYYDMDAFTKWEVKENVGLFYTKMPAEIVVEALEALSKQVRRFGPPSFVKGMICDGRKLGNVVELTITPLGPAAGVDKGLGGDGRNFSSTA